MPEYEPISLQLFCNVDAAFISSDAKPRVGAQTFHGLPFLIGGDEAPSGKHFIGFGGGGGSRKSVTVPVGQTARHVIVAHTLLESKLHEGEIVGREVAAFIFRYEDGEEVRVPIRERFEVAEVPTGWGESTFLAQPDQKGGLMNRWEGHWGAAGIRQCEANQAWPHDYYLWAWKNSYPEKRIESIRIEAGERKYLVAAITLGHLDEHPFPREGKREVLITLPEEAAKTEDRGHRRYELEVEVDRGVATFPYPLPEGSTEEFIQNAHRGWGEEQNDASSPSYVEIAATPSATVTVKNAGEELAQANWGELQEKGKIETPKVSLEVADTGKNWVKVSVLDDETGKPVPCRVHFRSPQGIPYQPHGHHNHVNNNQGTWHIDIGGDLRLGQITYAYIDGKCQGWLPRGEVIVDVARGFEYEPLRQKVEMKPGQRELELRLKRWTHMNRQGWYSGDTHVHFLGGQGAHREAAGEDLNVVNLLASQWGHLFTNTEDFIGKPTMSRDGNTIVYCSQENRQHLLGHLSLLGLKEPVYPWCTDGPSEAELGGTLEATMSEWADACHAQGGTVVIPHLPNPNGEPATLIATGRADAIEMLVHDPYNHIEYYRYLNGGYRLPLVGGTDKMESSVPVGLYRTYASLSQDEEFTYDNWCRAVRRGRTFLSGGPMIRFTVDGAEIGDTVNLSGAGTVEVEAEAESIFPIHTLQVVMGGQVVAQADETKGARRLHLKERVKVDGHAWLAARVGGPGYTSVRHHDSWRRGIFAHTSPVYVAVGGEWRMFSPETAQYMLTLVEGSLNYIRETAHRHPHGTVTHHHREDDHLAHLEEPFHAAAAAIHKRMHELGLPH